MIYTCDVLFFESDEMFDIVSKKKKKKKESYKDRKRF